MTKTQIDHISDGLVETLKNGGLNVGYLIAAFPDQPKDFDASGAKLVLLVQYVGSRYSGNLSGGSQMRQANFALHLSVHATAANINANAEIALIHGIIHGLQLCGCELSVTRDGLVDANATERKFVIELTTSFPTVPNARPEISPFLDAFPQTEAS